jgi:hypothetical protein
MVISIHFQGEAFSAERTSIRALACVHTHVISEANFPSEELMTDETLVLLSYCLHQGFHASIGSI